MKIMKLKQLKNINWVVSALIMLGLAACKKMESNVVGTHGIPTITSVRTISKTDTSIKTLRSVTTIDANGNITTKIVGSTINPLAFDSVTTSGKGGNLYQIVGANLGSVTKVTFNGVVAYFDPAYITNNSVIVTLPTTAPFGATQAGVLAVTTLYGTATFKFSVVQPPPTITSFNPVAAAPGDTVTITGLVLDNATSVKFGTTPATIVSNTSTQLKVLVPAGVVEALISVTTAGGTTVSTATFGFKYLIYLNGLTTGWGGNGGGYTGYSGTVFNFNNTTNPGVGKTSIAATFGGQYSAMQIGYGGATPVSVSALGLTAVKFSVYGGANSKNGDQLQVAVNGNYKVIITINAGTYTDFTIPLSAFGTLTNITEFVLQTFQASGETIYVDYIGFI
jgi:hypothetical protein